MSLAMESTHRAWHSASSRQVDGQVLQKGGQEGVQEGIQEGGHEEKDKRSALLFQISHYLLFPQNCLVFEGVRWSKISWETSRLAKLCATVRLIMVAILAAIPLLIGSSLNLFVYREAARLQEGRGFSFSGALSAPLPEKLRIVSLNICTFPGNWNLFFGGIETSGHERLERFVTLFQEQKADIICLQEVFEPAFALELRERLRAEGWEIALYNAGLDPQLPMTSGLFVASRLPIREARYIPFEPCFGGWLPRGALQLAVGGLDLFVTHLTPSREDLNPEATEISKRQAEIATIAEHVRKRPTVLVGDLNAQKTEFVSIGTLEDLSPDGATCTEQFTLDVAARLNGLSSAEEVASTALDRVFAKGIDIQTAIAPAFATHRDPNPLSDHHGLSVELTTPQVSST